MKRCALFAGTLVASLVARDVSAGLAFNFTPTAGMSAQAITGFQQAAARWSALFTDDVTINVAIDFRSMSGSTLGETSSNRANYTYTNYWERALGDRTSDADRLAFANLAASDIFKMRINYTSNNPNGVGSSIGYLDADGDANNSTIRATHANAKALGLRTATNTASDGSIAFNSNFTWDLDPTNGITPGRYDFVGVATHEIGHLLGFNSGVGTLDGNAPDPDTGQFHPDDFFDVVHPMDMFRYSTQSLAYGTGVIDYTAGTSDKYFSIDGGITKIASFSTGTDLGDGRQTGHWKDNRGIGIMDPTFSVGELGVISNTDLLLFDVLGWNLAAPVSIPEPAAPVTLAFFAATALPRRNRRV